MNSRLLAVDRTPRDVPRFGFPSLSKMKDAAGKILSAVLERIGRYPAVAGLWMAPAEFERPDPPRVDLGRVHRRSHGRRARNPAASSIGQNVLAT